MTDERNAKKEKKTEAVKDEPKVRAEVIEDLDVPSEDADALKGASGHIICVNHVQGS